MNALQRSSRAIGNATEELGETLPLDYIGWTPEQRKYVAALLERADGLVDAIKQSQDVIDKVVM